MQERSVEKGVGVPKMECVDARLRVAAKLIAANVVVIVGLEKPCHSQCVCNHETTDMCRHYNMNTNMINVRSRTCTREKI
jgi:hypothetical protein